MAVLQGLVCTDGQAVPFSRLRYREIIHATLVALAGKFRSPRTCRAQASICWSKIGGLSTFEGGAAPLPSAVLAPSTAPLVLPCRTARASVPLVWPTPL